MMKKIQLFLVLTAIIAGNTCIHAADVPAAPQENDVQLQEAQRQAALQERIDQLRREVHAGHVHDRGGPRPVEVLGAQGVIPEETKPAG